MLRLVFLILSSSQAWSVTIPHEIVPTDEGFRQRVDCRPIYRLRNWWHDHYWSVRPTWLCVDEPYFSGKGGLLLSFDPVEEIMPWPTLYVPPEFVRLVIPPFTAKDLPPPGKPTWTTPNWPTPITPTPFQPIPPISLPSSILMLITGIGMIFGNRFFHRKIK